MSAGDLAIRCADGVSSIDLLKLVVVNSADCSEYFTCENNDESIESIIKRVIVEDNDGNLAVNVCGCGDLELLYLIPQESPPASPVLGTVYTDTDNHIYFYNGSAWVQIDNDTPLAKATATDINTGTDDAKYITSLALEDSEVRRTVRGINPQSGTTYTIALDDAGKLVRCGNANPVTVTVPKNSVVAFPTGSVVTIEQSLAGQVTIAPVDGDVTVSAYNSGLKTLGQYAGVQLIKVDTNIWICIGGTA